MKKNRTYNEHSFHLWMKTLKIKRITIFFLVFAFVQSLAFSSYAQKSVNGKVADDAGEPLPGVTVIIKGTTNGSVTDMDGNYNITNIPDDATLQFSFVGMKTQEIVVGAQTTINVTMLADAIGLEEVVAVGYGTQKKGNLTGSVASVQSEDLVRAPVASTSNALAGRLSGVISKQGSGAPGKDQASLSIRGFGQPLVIVDGIEADFNTIDANEIESISVLKDASAAIYGARAGNGVILVTTKRGKQGKPTITLNSSYTSQSNTRFLDPVSSGQYAEIKRQGWHELGEIGNAPFSEEDIAKYYKGDDPNYPNTNWFEEVMRDAAPMHQHNLSVRGGSDQIKYYGFVGYLDQQSFLKSGDGNFKRYNARANIDAKINKNLSVQFDFSVINSVRNYPWRFDQGDGSGWYQDLWGQQPIYPGSLPDPTKYAYAGAEVQIVAESERDGQGYRDREYQNYKGSIALEYQVPFIKGLKAKAFANISRDYNFSKIYSQDYSSYRYNFDTDDYILAQELKQSSLTHDNSEYKIITYQASLNYERTFDNHNISALALFEAIDQLGTSIAASRSSFLEPNIDYLFGGSESSMTNYGSATETGRASYVGRLNYSYKNKYLLESTLRYDASAKFAPENRWGVFPSISLGWRISEEEWVKNSISAISNLKLRGGASKTGFDGIGNFLYLAGYNFQAEYAFGDGLQKTLVTKGLENPDFGWEEITIYNLGLDFGFWSDKLYGEFDVFSRDREGIAGYRSVSLPNTFGSAASIENLNSQNTQGFEVMLGSRGNISDVNFNFSGNVSYARTTWTDFDEPEYEDPDQERIYKQTGNYIDRTMGYRSDGLFTSQEEIDGLPYDQDGNANSTLRPGDIKIIDLNGDGIVDWKDQTVIAEGTIPHWMIGFNTDIKYKNFDLSLLFQGALGYSIRNNLMPGIGSTIGYENRWTEENNNANALVPRRGSIAASNSYYSDFFLRTSNYIRLKTLSFGYSLPNKLLKSTGLQSVRFYFAGTNLFTIDKLKKYGVDPEVTIEALDATGQAPPRTIYPEPRNGYYYPQQKTLTFGVNLSF
jgi:TonB-linked SusC/RagA family outer membrane protein